MMAFEGMEPFGGLAADFRAGVVAAAVRNAQRFSEESPVFRPEDFMQSLARAREGYRPAVPATRGEGLSPEALSALLDATLFGISSTVH